MPSSESVTIPKQCPCCGGASFVKHESLTRDGAMSLQGTGHYVQCAACGLRTMSYFSRDICLKIWNRRDG